MRKISKMTKISKKNLALETMQLRFTRSKSTIEMLEKKWNMFKVTYKNTRTGVLLLTLNIFHTFFCCFYCWLGTSKCYLGMLSRRFRKSLMLTSEVVSSKRKWRCQTTSQLTATCSKSTMSTLEKGVNKFEANNEYSRWRSMTLLWCLYFQFWTYFSFFSVFILLPCWIWTSKCLLGKDYQNVQVL